MPPKGDILFSNIIFDFTLHLIKHSRPDPMSAVRESSKALGKATPAAHKELLRCVKFVISTRNKGLKMHPKIHEDGLWRMEVHSNSDWAGDPNTGRSVGCCDFP